MARVGRRWTSHGLRRGEAARARDAAARVRCRIVESHPKDSSCIRNQAIWLALRREIVFLARAIKQRRRCKSELDADVTAAVFRRRKRSMLEEEMARRPPARPPSCPPARPPQTRPPPRVQTARARRPRARRPRRRCCSTPARTKSAAPSCTWSTRRATSARRHPLPPPFASPAPSPPALAWTRIAPPKPSRRPCGTCGPRPCGSARCDARGRSAMSSAR